MKKSWCDWMDTTTIFPWQDQWTPFSYDSVSGMIFEVWIFTVWYYQNVSYCFPEHGSCHSNKPAMLWDMINGTPPISAHIEY